MGGDEIGDIGVFGPIVLLQRTCDCAFESAIPDACNVYRIWILSQLWGGRGRLSLAVGSGGRLAWASSRRAGVVTVFVAPRDAVKVVVHEEIQWRCMVTDNSML